MMDSGRERNKNDRSNEGRRREQRGDYKERRDGPLMDSKKPKNAGSANPCYDGDGRRFIEKKIDGEEESGSDKSHDTM